MPSVFRWTSAQQRAYALDAMGGYTTATVAAAVGATVRQVEGWRRRPSWRARQKAEADALLAHMRAAWQHEIDQQVHRQASA